jgi:hypothetical protein
VSKKSTPNYFALEIRILIGLKKGYSVNVFKVITWFNCDATELLNCYIVLIWSLCASNSIFAEFQMKYSWFHSRYRLMANVKDENLC